MRDDFSATDITDDTDMPTDGLAMPRMKDGILILGLLGSLSVVLFRYRKMLDTPAVDMACKS